MPDRIIVEDIIGDMLDNIIYVKLNSYLKNIKK